jgi:m7GpppX diphosphatase
MYALHAMDYTLLAETPRMHTKESVASFIQQEITRPSKQWIHSIIDGNQERDEVILRTDEFVLLPDTERVNRYWRIQSSRHQPSRGFHPQRRMLNWLSIVHDPSLRTMRDLRGHHIPMLKRMLKLCMEEVERNTGIQQDQVMAYVHYPPSVYQLHVHFSYPYGQHCHRDTFRVHSLPVIINNLEIDSEYYAKATLYLALYRQSPHYTALTAPNSDGQENEDKARCPED